jgi:hypothetical protein
MKNVNLDRQIVHMNDAFWYFRSILQSDRGINEDVSHKIRAGLVKWRQTFDILCNNKVLNKLKDKIYMTVIRPAMMYGEKCWATKG